MRVSPPLFRSQMIEESGRGYLQYGPWGKDGGLEEGNKKVFGPFLELNRRVLGRFLILGLPNLVSPSLR